MSDPKQEAEEILATPLVGALREKLRYVAIHKAVMCGQNCAGVMCSHEMAKRISRLLNQDEGQ